MVKTLKPIQIVTSHESLQEHIVALLKRQLYLPLLKSIGQSKTTLNSVGLIAAIIKGTISYSNDKFIGKFSAELSKEFKSLGATWNEGWVIPSDQLPMEIIAAIQAGQRAAFLKASAMLDALNGIDPDEIADSIVVDKFFDKDQFKMEKDFRANVKNITIAPKLTPERIEVMRTEYRENIKRSIKDLTQEQTAKLREQVQQHVLAGGRSKALEKPVQEYLQTYLQDSFDNSLNRAKFIAKQETKLAMSTYTYDRYRAVGITQYRWKCVSGTSTHPVRPMHKALNNTIQSFDNPPVTEANGARNNPQEDYNCRCTAIPIIT